ncbi:hypothetical protein P154DRAFT_519390 [Amniculicola lignicola CBS 123094]|uniref:Ubiquitin-like 1-activating enzyme E1A n=1 Tax=Amniculicola lignicola CBS 123094 TaxID=1392246 RepID=A0A6A5WRM9_9PLEO|nr:hypothetical protein P154DRAFT_519390 [Amniculicola lignicola CBS 123094]
MAHDTAADGPPAATNGTFPAEDDAAGQTGAAIAQADTISAEEIALYDRQIRLWGVQAQEKIRTANILLVSIKALANEVAKNLVLAGIGSITLADHEVVTEDDLGAQFFVSDADVGKNRAEAAAPQVQKLNPRVNVNVIARDIRTETDPIFYAAYDVIIATDLHFLSMNELNSLARLANRPFYAGSAHGFYGFIFADLISHDFVVERQKSNVLTRTGRESSTRHIIAASTKKENGKMIEMVTKREIYTQILLANTSPLPEEIEKSPRRLRKVNPLLTCVRALWEYQREKHGVYPSLSDLASFTKLAMDKHKELKLPPETLKDDLIRNFVQNLGSELAPVTAFLGGQLAQDVINVLGMREQPIQNLMLFDGETSEGPIYALHPIFETVPDVDPKAVKAVTGVPTVPTNVLEEATFVG